MTDQAAAPTTHLSPQDIDDLRCVAGLMIPPSDEYGVPGADDDSIFADILASLGHDTEGVRMALAALARFADKPFATLDAVSRDGVVERYREAHGSGVGLLSRVILQCYYRDDRVLLALGIEPRPPFPKGNTLEQGDWTLLDPVRARARMWRADR
jgi:hypothetical protein